MKYSYVAELVYLLILASQANSATANSPHFSTRRCANDRLSDHRRHRFASTHSPANGSGVTRDGSGVTRDESGVARDESGVARDGSGVGRDGSGVTRDGSGVTCDGSGMTRDGSGMTRDGSGVARDGSGVNTVRLRQETR